MRNDLHWACDFASFQKGWVKRVPGYYQVALRRTAAADDVPRTQCHAWYGSVLKGSMNILAPVEAKLTCPGLNLCLAR